MGAEALLLKKKARTAARDTYFNKETVKKATSACKQRRQTEASKASARAQAANAKAFKNIKAIARKEAKAKRWPCPIKRKARADARKALLKLKATPWGNPLTSAGIAANAKRLRRCGSSKSHRHSELTHCLLLD